MPPRRERRHDAAIAWSVGRTKGFPEHEGESGRGQNNASMERRAALPLSASDNAKQGFLPTPDHESLSPPELLERADHRNGRRAHLVAPHPPPPHEPDQEQGNTALPGSIMPPHPPRPQDAITSTATSGLPQPRRRSEPPSSSPPAGDRATTSRSKRIWAVRTPDPLLPVSTAGPHAALAAVVAQPCQDPLGPPPQHPDSARAQGRAAAPANALHPRRQAPPQPG